MRRRRLRTLSAACVHSSRASSSLTMARATGRSEEHTSELQSQSNLVCRLLLEKKKKKDQTAEDLSVETTEHRAATPHQEWNAPDHESPTKLTPLRRHINAHPPYGRAVGRLRQP